MLLQRAPLLGVLHELPGLGYSCRLIGCLPSAREAAISAPANGGTNVIQDTSLSGTNRLFEAARSARRLPHWALALLMGVVFIFGAVLIIQLLALVLDVLLPSAMTGAGQEATLATPTVEGLRISLLLVLGFATVYVFVALWVRHYEGRSFRSIGFLPGRAAKKFARGAALGLLFFAAVVGILALLGTLAPRPVSAEQVGLPALGGVLLVGVGFLVQGPAEEVLHRGWILGSVGARYGLAAGVALNCAMFALAHILNTGMSVMPAINLLLVAVFLSIYALREGAIWGVCAWHWMWNWVQGNLFGLPVSGSEPLGGSLIALEEAGPDLITGGAFGPEGGLVVTLVLLVGIAALLLMAKRGASGRAVR